jgi:hypothetical protein
VLDDADMLRLLEEFRNIPPPTGGGPGAG